MPTRALRVAVAAGVLLVLVVAADASMDLTYHLEAQVDGRWTTLATYPHPHVRAEFPFGPGPVVELNESDVLPMRLRVDNGLPWSVHDAFEVELHGERVHAGEIAAAARGEGIAPFSVTARALLESQGGLAREPPGGESGTHHAWLLVRVGGDSFGADLALREVSR